MLPIYIVCHADCEPSAYLCTYFDKRDILYKKISVIKNELASLELTEAAGLVFMGGAYSVNDNLPWLADEIKLIQQAIEKDVPIMGVCFGAQLVSKALGAEVGRAEHMETGWHKIMPDTSKLNGFQPLNLNNPFEVFEWHEDVFSIPDGAIPIFIGDNLENQGYLHGKVLAMQFHLEMTEHMVYEWLERYQNCVPESSLYVQSPETITERLPERLDNLHGQADIIYDWWLSLGENS